MGELPTGDHQKCNPGILPIHPMEQPVELVVDLGVMARAGGGGPGMPSAVADSTDEAFAWLNRHGVLQARLEVQ